MSWWRARRVDVGLVVLALALVGPIVQDVRAQQASRQALTAAIWDDRSLRIDDYPIGVDRAEQDGHVYSDKAPGQPVFAVPAYALYRALGGEPATVLRVEGNLGLWFTSLWSSAIPVAVLLLLVRRAVARVNRRAAPLITVTLFAGTLLLPFGSVLFGHALSSCLAFGGWYLVSRGRPTDRALLGAGALLGAAVLTEYTMVLVVVPVAVHVALSERARVGRFVAGGVPSVLALLGYQWAAFGSPFAFSYARSSFGSASRELGLVDQDPPLLDNALRVLAGERGLLLVSPVLLVATLGTVALIRGRSGAERSAYVAGAGAAAALVGVQMFWSNPTGGDSPGARYATAAAAFLAPGLAAVWDSRRLLARSLGAIGALIMVAATWTDPLEARDSRGAIGIWLRKLLGGDWTLTIYEMALGRWAAALLPLGVLGALALLFAPGLSRPRAAPASDP